jgi:hypothetical protein
MASEIKVDTVSEKTSGSGVTIDGLLIKDGGISGDVSLIGTTPTFTIGDAGAEDAALVFDGNAQDFYIALDDSADDLLIGLGSTVGTTPAISIDENLQVKIVATTASTSATTGSFIAAGGAGIAADLSVGDDLRLISDAAVLSFGADSEITVTHEADVGLKLKHTATADDKPIVLTLQTGETDIAANDVIGAINFQAPDESTGTDAILVAAGIEAVSEGDFSSSSNATKLSFKTGASEAAAEKMSLSSAGLLTIADDLVIKDGGTIGVSSDADSITIASNGAVTFSQTPVFPDGSIAVADLDIDGATDIGAAIVDADLFIIDDGAGGTNRKTTASRLKTYVGSGVTLLGSIESTSDASTIAIDSVMDETSYAYYIIAGLFKSGGNGATIEARFRDGGSALTASVYNFSNLRWEAGESSPQLSTGASSNHADIVDGVGTRVFSFYGHVFPCTTIANMGVSICDWSGKISAYASGSRNIRKVSGVFEFVNTTVPDGFQIVNQTANFEDYEMRIYGVTR